MESYHMHWDYYCVFITVVNPISLCGQNLLHVLQWIINWRLDLLLFANKGNKVWNPVSVALSVYFTECRSSGFESWWQARFTDHIVFTPKESVRSKKRNKCGKSRKPNFHIKKQLQKPNFHMKKPLQRYHSLLVLYY